MNPVTGCRLEFECRCCNQSMSAHVESEQLAEAMAWLGYPAIEVDEDRTHQMEGRIAGKCVECIGHERPCHLDAEARIGKQLDISLGIEQERCAMNCPDCKQPMDRELDVCWPCSVEANAREIVVGTPLQDQYGGVATVRLGDLSQKARAVLEAALLFNEPIDLSAEDPTGYAKHRLAVAAKAFADGVRDGAA